MTVSIAEARDRLSELVRLAEAGELVEIGRYNGPATVRLVAVQPLKPQPLDVGWTPEEWRTIDLTEPVPDWEAEA